MAKASQGQIYRCDFGKERGVELAHGRLALVISADTFNQGSSSVLVVPTTRGAIDPKYVDYYPPLEQIGTCAASRNLRTIHQDRLGSFQTEATRGQLVQIARGALWPYLDDGILLGNGERSERSPGNVHNGFIPNHHGDIEESWFLILAYNENNGFATIVKVDQKPVGQSQVRVPLAAIDGPQGMAAYSHQVQPVDLNEAFTGLIKPSYRARIHDDSLAVVIEKVKELTTPPPLGYPY